MSWFQPVAVSIRLYVPTRVQDGWAFVLSRRVYIIFFFFSSRRRHTRLQGDWSSDVCSSDLLRCIQSPEISRKIWRSVGTYSRVKIENHVISVYRLCREKIRVFALDQMRMKIGRASCRERV